jgi:hypothetical protein
MGDSRQQEASVAQTRMRHPQYVWLPAAVAYTYYAGDTLVMFPILVWVYARLAKAEERDAIAEFGAAYEAYRKKAPAFIPAFGRKNLASGNSRQLCFSQEIWIPRLKLPKDTMPLATMVQWPGRALIRHSPTRSAG